MFVSYIAAAFIALLGVALVLLLISKKEIRDSKQSWIVMSFAFVVLAECILYFYFYFADMVLKQYAVNVGLRVVDYFLYGAVLFCWMNVIRHLDIIEMKRIRIWAWVIGILYSGSGVIAALFFMDDYYSFYSASAGRFFTYLEIVLAVLTVVIMGRYTLEFARNSVSKVKRIYVVIVSIVLLLWVIQQIFVGSNLYMGVYQSAWAEGEIDTTGVTMFIVGLATFIVLFREDFSPLYYAKAQGNRNPEVTQEHKLEQIAEQHHLTVRELDVLKLVYCGKNNAEIAEELFISINTVKKHLKNIYEKMGTSSRMELMYIISHGKNE